jgi:hypothetical protein
VKVTINLINSSELVNYNMDGDQKGKARSMNLRDRTLSLLDRFLHSRRSNLYLGLVLLLIASLPRFFYIGRDIHPNGVDEGVQIMAGRMLDAGYDFYTQINTVQAPLMLSIYGAIEGDPIIFRIFSTLASLVIMVFVMWVGKRVGGRHVMVAAGAFAAMDLMFLHESRLASLDMFCLLWIAVAVGFFIKYRQSGKKWALLLMGFSLGIGAMIKLFAVIAAGVMGIIMFFDWINDTDAPLLDRVRTSKFLPGRKFHQVRFIHMVLLVLSFALVVLFIMARFGIVDVFEGMFLNQLNRPVSPFTRKLRFFGVFVLLNSIAFPFFFLGLKPLYKKPEGIIIIITLAFFFYFMFQAATWIHHFVFLSPGLSLTAGVGVIRLGKMIERYRRKKEDVKFPVPAKTAGRTILYIQVVLMLLVAVIGGGFSLVVKERGQSAQYKAASLVEDLTEPEDFVISGDPMIAAIADRPQPPPVVNVARLKYPDVTNDMLNETTIIYGVEVVIITYHLAEMEGYVDFIEMYYKQKARYVDNTLPLLEEENEHRVFILPGDSDLRDHELWKLEELPDPNER